MLTTFIRIPGTTNFPCSKLRTWLVTCSVTVKKSLGIANTSRDSSPWPSTTVKLIVATEDVIDDAMITRHEELKTTSRDHFTEFPLIVVVAMLPFDNRMRTDNFTLLRPNLGNRNLRRRSSGFRANSKFHNTTVVTLTDGFCELERTN